MSGQGQVPASSGAPVIVPASAVAGNETPSPPAAAPLAAGDGVAPAGGGSPPAPSAESASPPAVLSGPVKKDWRDDRIRVLTAKLAEARAADPAATPPAGATAGAPPAAGTAEFVRAVEIAAAQRAEIDSFNNMCNTIASDGKARFGEPFLEKVKDLMNLVDKNDPQSLMIYNSMLMAANESGDAAATILELGSDLNEAARVLAMSPIKMAAELTRKTLARKAIDPAGAGAVLPKPIVPLGRAGQQHSEIDPADPARGATLPSAEWHKRREEQVEANRRAKLGLPAQAQA